MRIGNLASQCGLTTKTIRYYESIGLLIEPERSASGYRQYGDDVVRRLRFVADAQCAGLSLNEIRSILALKDAGATSCEHTLALLERHIDDIDDQMTRLGVAKAELVRLAERARSLDPAECTDPHRCQVVTADRIPAGNRHVVAGGRS
jgi:DNA-binding transcriptional MerR regulator